MSIKSLEQAISTLKHEIKELAETNKSFKHEIERLQAAREIENLKNRYTWKLCAYQYDDLPEMFALKTPGLRVELGNSGVYEGAEGIKRMYLGIHKKFFTPSSPGQFISACNTSPVIEVAEDGETAKGLWNSFGLFTLTDPEVPDGKPEAMWGLEKHAMDFVKEDGRWKIWHYRAYILLICPFYKSWADMKEAYFSGFSPILPDELKPDKPITYHKPYSPEYVVEYVPKVPEQYATWEETFSY